MNEPNQPLIPYPELVIFPDIHYVDGYDMSQRHIAETRRFFANDEEYKKLSLYRKYLNLDNCPVSRAFNIHVFKGNSKLGLIRFVEIQNHPEGYGIGDFRIIKLIYPEYRRTKYSRYVVADLVHILFFSGIAKRIYFYQRGPTGVENFTGNCYCDINQESPPCASPKLPTDDKEVSRFVSVKKVIPTNLGYSIVLYEEDGENYVRQDHKAHLMAPPGRKEEVVDRWLIEMNTAAKKVKDSYGLSDTGNLGI